VKAVFSAFLKAKLPEMVKARQSTDDDDEKSTRGGKPDTKSRAGELPLPHGENSETRAGESPATDGEQSQPVAGKSPLPNGEKSEPAADESAPAEGEKLETRAGDQAPATGGVKSGIRPGELSATEVENLRFLGSLASETVSELLPSLVRPIPANKSTELDLDNVTRCFEVLPCLRKILRDPVTKVHIPSLFASSYVFRTCTEVFSLCRDRAESDGYIPDDKAWWSIVLNLYEKRKGTAIIFPAVRDTPMFCVLI